MIQVEIANEQSKHVFDAKLIERAVHIVLVGESVSQAEVSVAIVDDLTMHRLNLKYLQHDYTTDVLSFLLSRSEEALEGEIVVCADMAEREAQRFGWDSQDELLLYLIHGTLHLVGLDDASASERAAMRSKERHYLALLGRQPNYEERPSPLGDCPAPARPEEGENPS